MTWRRVARAQGGTISAAQLASCGRPARTVSRMADRGELVRLGQGVYLVGGAPVTYRARLWAAVLSTRGTLGLTTAGRLWGVLDEADPEIHVIVPHSRRVRGLDGVRIYRQDLPARAVGDRSGLPTTTRTWTVLDLLGALPEHEASRLADRAMQRRWITERDIGRRLDHHPGRRGNVRLRRLTLQVSDGAAARSERLLHTLLRRAGLTSWRPNFEIWSSGELIGVVDVAFPDRRIAIEVDGMAFHVDVDRFRGDRRRQNALVALGWTVLRFTWADLTERPGYVIATIRRLAA